MENKLENIFKQLPYTVKQIIYKYTQLVTNFSYSPKIFDSEKYAKKFYNLLIDIFGTDLYTYINKYIFTLGCLVKWKNKIYTVTGIYESADEVSLISCVDNCELIHIKMSECTVISDDYKKDYKVNDVVINNRTGSLCIIKELPNEYLAIVSTVSDLNNNFNDSYDTYTEYVYNLTSAYYTLNEKDLVKIDLTNKVKVGDLIYSTVIGYVNVLSVSDDKIVINTDNETIELDKYGALSENGECLIYPYKDVRNWESIEPNINTETSKSNIDEQEHEDAETSTLDIDTEYDKTNADK